MSTELTIPQSLDNAKPIGLNLSATYWSPTQEGETKRLYFVAIKNINHINEQTGETKNLQTAIFVDPASKEVINQGSARLVGIFERENPPSMTAYEIRYKGKVKNSTNQFSSDSWEVYQLNVDNDTIRK